MLSNYDLLEWEVIFLEWSIHTGVQLQVFISNVISHLTLYYFLIDF